MKTTQNYTINIVGRRSDNIYTILSKEDIRLIKNLWKAHVASFWGSRTTEGFNALLSIFEKRRLQTTFLDETKGILQFRVRNQNAYRHFQIQPV